MTILLTTDRLVVRRFDFDDVDAFLAYRNDPDVARFQGWSLPYDRIDAEILAIEMANAPLFRLGEWTQLALGTIEDPKTLIGDIGVRIEALEPTAEIGFTIARTHWGNGYGAEALDAVVAHLLDEIDLVRAVAFTHQANLAAQRSLERAGLRYVTMDGDDMVYYRRRAGHPGSQPEDLGR